MPSKTKQSPEARFWEWFQLNEERLFNFELDQNRVFRELIRELRKIDRSLTFEFSSVEHGKRQFVISADGRRAAFPAVNRLADAAPELPRWQIVRFRPRRLEPCVIGIGGLSISSDDVEFSLTQEGRTVGVTLFLGDEKSFDERLFGQIAFLLLDHTLGEYDVETYVGSVTYKPRDALSMVEKRPLRELPVMIDHFIQSLSN